MSVDEVSLLLPAKVSFVERGFSATLRNPTRLKKGFRLPLLALLGLLELGVVARGWDVGVVDRVEENVGVIKCGDFDLPRFSFSAGDEMGR